MKMKPLFIILRVLYLTVAIPLGLVFLFTPPIGWVLLFVTVELYDELKMMQRIMEQEERDTAEAIRRGELRPL